MFPTSRGLGLHLGQSSSCGEKLRTAQANFNPRMGTNSGQALSQGDMEITYNTDDVGNLNEGDLDYSIPLNVDQFPVPPDTLPEPSTNSQSRQRPQFVHSYPGQVATVVREAETLFDTVCKEQDAQGNNPAAPFHNKEEWDLAKWLIKNVSQIGIEEFASLAIVSGDFILPIIEAYNLCQTDKLDLSFKSKYTFMKAIDSLPQSAEWSLNMVEVEGDVPGVSQSVDLGQRNNPNTTPTKDYENVRVVVYLCGVQRGYAEEGERGSTPTG